MEKLIDMHMHTNYSDGGYSPDELIRMAIEKNIGTMAITDHDTLRGIKSVDKSKYPEIKIFDGIELSAKVDHGQIHILGYGFDLENVNLNKKLSELQTNNINSVITIYEQIKKDYGIRFNYEDLVNLFTANHNLGRPDLAKLCVKYGFASATQEAFDKYLNPANDKNRQYTKGIPYSECIELIKNSGGIPVLAHPKSLKLDEEEFLKVLRNMIDCGLMGIEVYHSSHSKEEMGFYLKIANEYGLLVSGGSDYHGKGIKTDIELGTGKNNNIKIKKLSLVDRLNQS